MTEDLDQKCGIKIGDLMWCNHPERECPYINKDKYLLIRYHIFQLHYFYQNKDVQKLYRECKKEE